MEYAENLDEGWAYSFSVARDKHDNDEKIASLL